MARLFVGGLPASVEREELEKVFGRFGELEDVWVARKPPGFAFVQFVEVRHAEDALRNLNDSSNFGVTIRVEFSTRSGGSGRGRRSSPRRGPPARRGRDLPSYRNSPPSRPYRGSPPRMYRSPPRSYRMSPPPQRSYRPSPPPQRYFPRSPQRSFRASPPPARPMYRDSSPPTRSYRAASPPPPRRYNSPPRQYDSYDTMRAPVSRDYGSTSGYGGLSPVRSSRPYSPPRSTVTSYGADMSSRYPGARYRSRSRSPVSRGYY